ncbi:hypothetical protein [Salinibacterium sp.]|uniref:hypothetical protein n=1 Tax=Salinibacterium sp. TaxID=1915057 RepID=UPI00286CD642|nr:hypothetical protein [Salinibacterium sp.]
MNVLKSETPPEAKEMSLNENVPLEESEKPPPDSSADAEDAETFTTANAAPAAMNDPTVYLQTESNLVGWYISIPSGVRATNGAELTGLVLRALMKNSISTASGKPDEADHMMTLRSPLVIPNPAQS